MDEGEFIMPVLNNMVTKASQIEGLRVVRMAVVKAYKAMWEKEKHIRRLFPQMNHSRGRGGGIINQYEGGNNNNNQVRNDNQLIFHNKSQTEPTLSRYGGVR